MKDVVAARPTEVLSGTALGLVIYGFATQVGIPEIIAGSLAVGAAFGPLLFSRFVDIWREG